MERSFESTHRNKRSSSPGLFTSFRRAHLCDYAIQQVGQAVIIVPTEDVLFTRGDGAQNVAVGASLHVDDDDCSGDLSVPVLEGGGLLHDPLQVTGGSRHEDHGHIRVAVIVTVSVVWSVDGVGERVESLVHVVARAAPPQHSDGVEQLALPVKAVEEDLRAALRVVASHGHPVVAGADPETAGHGDTHVLHDLPVAQLSRAPQKEGPVKSTAWDVWKTSSRVR